MFNQKILSEVLKAYKRDFAAGQWAAQKGKWQAVLHFKEHWDMDAPDFCQMFLRATDKTFRLLSSMNHYPRTMMKRFAQADPQTVREMFLGLFDESRDLAARCRMFESRSQDLLRQYGGSYKRHYQSLHAISTYLWLRYPDTYYIYKYAECRSAAQILQSDFSPRRAEDASRLQACFAWYEQLQEQLQKDEELVAMVNSALNGQCYRDPCLHILAVDVVFYISRVYARENGHAVLYGQASPEVPEIPLQKWQAMLLDPSVANGDALQALKCLLDYGAEACSAQLSTKYGQGEEFFQQAFEQLAKRVLASQGCLKESISQPVQVLCQLGCQNGQTFYKLRPMLKKALQSMDLSQVPLYAQQQGRRYWWITANPRIWSFSSIQDGQSCHYTQRNESGHKRRIFQHFLNAQPGDLVVGYESSPVQKVVALGQIASADKTGIYLRKTQTLTTPLPLTRLKQCLQLKGMEYFLNPQGSLFALSKGEYDCIVNMLNEQNPRCEPGLAPGYTKEQFLQEVYMDAGRLDALSSLVAYKKNVILYGAPGVGKTYAAKRLAYAIMGQKDDTRIEMVQFHQNYSYEDFILGFKPHEESFQLQQGVFYRFCQKAQKDSQRPYFFIIDEINRGNLSKIFGELLLLIEKDYRGFPITLAYGDMPFSVPPNICILATMNTADRSLAMIDYALRRRFSFFEMAPGFSAPGFAAYQKKLQSPLFNALIEQIKALNEEIEKEPSLGKGFLIGHSYFCGPDMDKPQRLKQVVQFDIVPMLEEYWFDQPQKALFWQERLNGVFA